MKEQLAKEILKHTLEIIKETKDFTLQQAPLLAQEIVDYSIASGGITLAGCVCLIAFSSYVMCSVFTKENVDDAYFLAGLFGGSMGVCLGVVGLLHSGHMFLKAIYAPRLLIIEKITEML